MNENLNKLKRAINYLFRPGNALYLGILAIVLCLEGFQTLKDINIMKEIFQAQGVNLNCDPGTDVKCFTAMLEFSDAVPSHYGITALKIIAVFLFFCKMFDGILRLSEGMEDDPVPFAPVSVVPFLTPLKYIAGSILLALATLPIAFIFGLRSWQLCLILINSLFMPAMVMNLIGNDSIFSMISPRAWLITINNMGIKNYLALLLFPLLVTFLLSFVFGFFAALMRSEGLIIIGMQIVVVLAVALIWRIYNSSATATKKTSISDTAKNNKTLQETENGCLPSYYAN